MPLRAGTVRASRPSGAEADAAAVAGHERLGAVVAAGAADTASTASGGRVVRCIIALVEVVRSGPARS